VTDISAIPLVLVGDPRMGVCEGDFCEIPDHHEAAVINGRLDRNEI